jgi:predicted outer membrane repeat protein
MLKKLLLILVFFTWIFNPAGGRPAIAGASQAASFPSRTAAAEPVSAIVVDDLSDTAVGGDGLCSLREAIMNANAALDTTSGDCTAGSSGLDSITFAASGTITLTASLPLIDDDLAIDGSGRQVALSGSGAYQVLVVTSQAKLELNQLTIAHGSCDSCNLFGIFNYGGGIYNAGMLLVKDSVFIDNHAGGPDASGGAIYNRGTLTVTHSTFSGNTTTSRGGGIYNYNGKLTLLESSFSANQATGAGGGIYHDGGTLAVTGSTFSANRADSGAGIYDGYGALMVASSSFSANEAVGPGGYGGGILIDFSASAAVAGSTFSANQAVTGGGGISNGGALTLANSTLSANSAAREGGGIYSNGTLTVTNATLSANRASSGGGLYIHSGVATLRNSIVANSPDGGNCAGSIANGGHNLDSQAACGWAAEDGSLSDADPRLGPLADNGGASQTFALLAFSPAIDAGDDEVCRLAPVEGFDQRGMKRPVGPHCDIGAFESPGYPKFLFVPLAAYNSPLP